MTAPRTDDPLSEFDKLTKKKPATDPLAAFDLLVGGSTTGSDKGGDITLPPNDDRQPQPKPEARREPSILTRDLAPVVRKSASRAKHAIGGALDRLLAGDAYQRSVIPRVEAPTAATPLAHPLAPVTVEADPQKVVRHLKRLDPITQVLANTQAGIDTAPAGAEAPYDEASYQQTKARLTDKYNATADDFEKKRLVRMLGQLEKQRSEALALRKEDPISTMGRTATFGALQTPERFAIRREHERDIEEGRAVTPEEVGAEGIIHEGERPHRVEPGETGSQAIAGLAGSILPFEVGERAGMHIAGKIADAIEVGVPRARSIAQALRYAEAPITAETEFGRGVQAITKGAIRGQAGGAFMGATEATIHDQPVGETLKAGIVPYAELGSLFGAAGAGFKIPTDAIDKQTGAYIAQATHMVDATRPDRTPIGDKMPEAHGRAIADLLNRLIGVKKAGMTPDERLALAAAQKRPPEDIEIQPAYTSRESRVVPEPEVPLRSQRDIVLSREGVEQRAPVEQITSAEAARRSQEATRARVNTLAGQDETARRLISGMRTVHDEGGVRLAPETRPDRLAASEPVTPEQSFVDQHDMSKNLERVQEEQRVAEEQRVQQEAAAQAQAEAEARKPAPTFAEQLMAAGKGDAVQRMKDSDLVAYARRVARHTDKVGRELQRKVWDEIKGRGLDKKVGPAALALAAIAGASQTEDEGKRAALLGAAALGLSHVDLGELRLRFNRGETAADLAKRFRLSPEEVRKLAEVKPTREEIERRLVGKKESLSSIAREYGMETSEVEEIRLSGQHARSFDEKGDVAERDKEIAARYAGGGAASALAREYNMTRGDVHRIVREQGGEVEPNAERDAMIERRIARDRKAEGADSPYLSRSKAAALGKRAVLPAALAIAASQTSDDDEGKRAALLGAAALTTGIHEGEVFHSRVTRAVEALPKQWESARPAGDWLGKLGGAGNNFSREEFDRVLRPYLEKAKAEKRKLTKAEVIAHTETNRIELNLDRTTPSGQDIKTPYEAPPAPPPMPHQRARELTVDNVRGAEPGDGPHVLEVRQGRNNEVEQAEERFSEAEDDHESARRQLYQNPYVSDRAIDKALEKADEGDGIDVDKAMEWLMDDIETEPPEGSSEPEISSGSNFSVEEVDNIDPDTGEPDPDIMPWQVIGRNGRVRGEGHTRLEAMAEHGALVGDDALGNLQYLLGPDGRYEVRELDDGTFTINRKSDGVVMAGRSADRDQLVEDFVRDSYEPPEDTARDEAYTDLRDQLEAYDRARREYNEIESETYSLREGAEEDDTDFMERLEEARQQDTEEAEAARREQLAQLQQREGLRDFDPEFYDLDEQDQQFIRDAQARGAVGVLTPFWDNVDDAGNTETIFGRRVGEAQGAQNVLVFDPAIPHYTFPREGTRAPNDPNQISLFDPETKNAVVYPPRETVTLKATGSTRFQTYQRTPGGQNYREIKVSWGNPSVGQESVDTPKHTVVFRKGTVGGAHYGNDHWQIVDPEGHDIAYETFSSESEARNAAKRLDRDNYGSPDFMDDHWAGSPPNTAVHGRIDEHVYTGEMGMHPALQKIVDERNILTKELGRIGDEYSTLEAANGGHENATPEMHALAARYRDVSAQVNALDEKYAEGAAAGYGPGTHKLIATNLMEAQSDWKQMGEAGGFYDARPVSAARRAELKTETERIKAEEDAATEAYEKANREYDETPEGKRYQELTDKYYQSYNLPPEENAEWMRLSKEKDAAYSVTEDAFNDARDRLRARRDAINAELQGKKLLPGEAERLANNLAKAKEGLRVAEEKLKETYRAYGAEGYNDPVQEAASRAAGREKDAAQSRVYRLESAQPVPNMPWKDPDSAFGLAAAMLLKEAAFADSDLATWSHSTNRMALANLSKKAAEITYDTAVHGQVRKLLKGLGFDVRPEIVTMDGHKHWMIRLTPAMKEAIKKASFPLLTAMALLSAPKEASAQNGEDKGMSAVPYLIALGLMAGAFKTLKPEMIERLKRRAKEGGWDSKTVSEMRVYSNPIVPAMKELKRVPAAATVTAVAALAANSDNKDIKDTALPLFALAALSAIGSKNLAASRDALGKVLVDKLHESDRGTRLVRFVNPDALLSPDVKAAILAYEATRAKGTARQVEYTRKLKKLGPMGDRLVSDFIEGEQFEDPKEVRAMKPEDVHAIAVVAQEAADEVERGTQMQIESGALDPAYAIDHYLPGKYAYWEALDAMTERAPRGGGATQKPRISIGKRRTLGREDVAERNRLGEIREASYRVGVAIDKAYANSAAATLFKTLRATPGVIHPEYMAALDDFLAGKDLMRQAKATNNTADVETAQAMLDDADLRRRKISAKFKLKGGDYVTMPDTKAMGVLRGMVVQRDVGNSLNGIPEKRATDKLLKFWKLSKTVFNPGTHAANVISNTTMAHMAGMRMTEQPFWLTKAAGDMKRYGEGTRRLAELGVLDVNVVNAGGEGKTARSARSEEGLSELMQTTRPETSKVLRDIGIEDPKQSAIPTFRKAAKATQDLYNDEDNIFRVAMYLKARAPKSRGLTLAEGGGFGMSPEEAAKYARDSFGNFRTRSPLLRVIRGSVAPFILYPAKALPAFAKNVVDHPVRYLTLMAMWGALNEYSKQEVGEIPEEDIDERDRRTWGYFFPGLTQLPFVSKTGAHAATDLARWTPMSGATDVALPGTPAAAISPNVPKFLQPSGPLTDIYGKFVNNIDPFTHQPRYKADYPLKRNIGRALEDVIQLVAPSALGFHRERIMQDIDDHDMEALKTDLLGPTGLRPRYLRAGGNVMNAEIERQRSMQDAKAEARRALSHSQSPDRDAEIMKDYLEYADKIEKNFERRAAIHSGKK